jgi:hypothetical protein
MFDISNDGIANANLAAVRVFFATFLNELAKAARILGGIEAEARVLRFAVWLEKTDNLDARMIRDLHYFRDLLLADVPTDPDDEGSSLYPCLDPASPAVERICVVTDALEGLLVSIGENVSGPNSEEINDGPRSISG